jgi:hypothetical protein
MTKNISYRILPDLELIVESYYGIVSINDYIQLKTAQLIDNQFNPLFSNIADIRNTELSISNDDIIMCINFMKSANGLIGKRRAAVLTATPNQVAISILFARYGKELPVQYEVVSTLEAALKWVKKSPSDYTRVKSVMTEIINGVSGYQK